MCIRDRLSTIDNGGFNLQRQWWISIRQCFLIRTMTVSVCRCRVLLPSADADRQSLISGSSWYGTSGYARNSKSQVDNGRQVRIRHRNITTISRTSYISTFRITVALSWQLYFLFTLTRCAVIAVAILCKTHHAQKALNNVLCNVGNIRCNLQRILANRKYIE